MIIIIMYNNIHMLLSTKLTTPDTTIYYTANHNISTIYNNIFSYHYTKRHSNQSPQLQRLAKIAISSVAGLDVILSNT